MPRITVPGTIAQGQPVSAATLNAIINNDSDHESRISTNTATVAKQITDTGFDLVVLAGQSNMVGRGSPIDLTYLDPPDSRIMQWAFSGTYANQISQAIEPLTHPDSSTGVAVGPGIPFARWYEMNLPTNRKILLVPTAFGGTGFSTPSAAGNNNNWNITSTGSLALYPQSVAQAKAALAAAPAGSRIIAVLWLQGEQDASNNISGSVYATYLDALIAQYRTDFNNPTLPFILGQTTYDHRIAGTYPANAVIDTVHQATPTRNQYCGLAYSPHVLGVQTTGFTDATAGIIHYSAAGQRLMGRQFYDAYLQGMNNVTGVAPVSPGPVTMVQATGAQIAVDWVRPLGRATNYLVEYSINAGSSWTTVTRTASGQPWQLITTGPVAGNTVLTRVSTINEQGTSSPTVSAALTLAAPVIPSTPSITAAPGGTGSVVISGTSANATSFSIYRGTTAAGESGTPVATGQVLPWSDSGLTQGTTYYYYVTGVNGNGTSPNSNEVSSVPGVGFADNFNRANATTTGNGWVTPTSQTALFPINNNQVGITGTSATAATTYLDFSPYVATAGSMQATVQIVAIGPGSSNFPSVVIAADSATAPTSYYFANYNVTGSDWYIAKNTSGTDTTLVTTAATYTAPTLPVNVQLALTTGGVLTLYVAGTSVATYTDSTPLTGTRVGFRFRAGGTSQGAATATEVMRVDNFSSV